MADGRKVSFSDHAAETENCGEENGDIDADHATDMELLRGKQTWSRKQLQRITKLFDQQPSRKKIFTEIQASTDVKTWNIEVYNRSITCVKVFNPAILNRNSEKWDEISKAQRLEVEDPEGILTEIPKHVAEMTKLDSFSITWTKVKTLPNSLFHTNMRSLYVQRNQLKSLNGIEAAENLENLDASNNLLTVLPNGIGQLSNLQTLNFSGNGIKELPKSIGLLHQLKSLDCSCNKLKILPDSICNMIELTILDVGNNYLNVLPASIGNLPRLEDLRARSNQLSALPKKFGQLINLKSLLLRKNQFQEVPVELSSLTNLQNLNMKDNMISKMAAPIISLRSLILDGNEFETIEKNILLCSNLRMLWLQKNKLREIPEDIKLLKNLRALHLSENDIRDVPESFREMDQLKHLSLRSTKITIVPDVLANMTNVTVELDECVEKKSSLKREKDRNTVFGGFGLVSRIRNSIFAPDAKTVGASFGKPSKERSRCASQFPTTTSGKGSDDDDDFVVEIERDKHTSIFPPNSKKQENVEMQTCQGLLVAQQIQSKK